MFKEKLTVKHAVWTVIIWVMIIASIAKSVILIMNMKKPVAIEVGIIAGVCALLFAAFKASVVLDMEKGNEFASKISQLIQKATGIFLQKGYTYIVILTYVLAMCILGFVSISAGLCFLAGVACSIVAGHVGIVVATKTNARTVEAAEVSLNKSFKTAFSGALVGAMLNVGILLAAITILYWTCRDAQPVFCFVLGSGLIALFSRIGGGIYSNASSICMAGEKDPKNPLVVANNVGKNAVNILGVSSDIFESCSALILAAIFLGAICLNVMGAFFPIVITGIGIFCSIVATYFVRIYGKLSPINSIRISLCVSTTLMLTAVFFLIKFWLVGRGMGIFYAVALGVLAGIFIACITEYYTSLKFKPVKNIVDAASMGSASAIVSGINPAVLSTFFMFIVMSLTIIGSFLVIDGMGNYTLGMYGVTLAFVGMLSSGGMLLAINTFGAITQSAEDIAQSTNSDSLVKERIEKINNAAHTAAPVVRGFLACLTVFIAFAIFSVYANLTKLDDADILNPFVTAGLLFGAAFPFLFCALVSSSVNLTAKKMHKEFKDRFENKTEELNDSDYKEFIAKTSKAAHRGAIMPGLIAIGLPLAIWFGLQQVVDKILAMQTLTGILMGAIIVSGCLIIMMTNSGSAWSNAKNSIKANNNDDCEAAAAASDTLGGLFKDVCAPALGVLIKLMTIVSIVCVSLSFF